MKKQKISIHLKGILTILMCVLTLSGFAQTKTVTGTVVDKQNEPVIGVAVRVSGTSIAAATNLDGKFSLNNVPENGVLEVSFMGMKTQNIPVAGKTVLRITMEDDAEQLDEVVVVGYGTQKKVNLTGAISQVGSDVLENRPIVNLGQGLQGVIPNLNVNVNSGAPGQGASFNVRGTTSLNGGSPLVLVDNVQMDPNLLNPADIASITVLKDAASAAIYGAKAAYGVILITTKNGTRGQAPKITFSANGYWQSPAKKIETINSMEFLTMKDLAYQNGGGSGHYYNAKIYEYAKKYFDGEWKEPVFFDKDMNQYNYQYCGNTNWWDEIYKKSSFSQQYNIGVNGGSENTTYYASLGYNNVGGILKDANDYYRKMNANLNLSSNLNKWLNVSGKIMYNFTDELHPAGGVSAANSTAYAGISPYSGYLKNDLFPLMPVRHPDGNFAGQGNFTNPIAIQTLGGNYIAKQNDLWLTGAFKITPVKQLSINGQYTFNYYGKGSKTHVRKFYDYKAVAGSEKYYPWTNPNSVVMANNEDYYSAFDLFGQYSESFLGVHNFQLTAGYNQEYKNNQYFYAGRKDLIDNDNPSLNLATGDRLLGASATHRGTQGLFARLTYNYNQRYLLELNGRYDTSSKFPAGKRSHFFPSIALGWRISEESFWSPLKTFWDDMKIRASYGTLGNQVVDELGNFPYLPSYGVTTAMDYLLNGSTPVAVTPSGLVSNTLTWETVNQMNIGFDAIFLRNRLFFTFDWFKRDTKNMLTSGQVLPAVLGTNVPNENAADLTNKGFDLSIEWRDKLDNGISYHIKGVLSDYTATITRFSNPTGNIGQYYVGRKIGEIWGYRSNGLFQSDAEVAAAPTQSALWGGKWSAGDVHYVDINKDNKIDWGNNTLSDSGDKVIIGNKTPRFAYGITGGMEFRGIDFQMFWQGIGKRDFDAGGVHFWGFTSEWDTPLKPALDYWTPENTGAYFARPNWNNGGNRQVSDRYLQNAAYIRLKNLTLGYTLPGKLIAPLNISTLRVFLSGENLLTFTKLIKSFDPETIGNMTYPISKKVSVGINITL